MQLGIYEKAINNKFSWKEKIRIAKKAGYDFIEFSVDESIEKSNRLNWSDSKINELRRILIDENFYFNSMALTLLRKYPLGSYDENIRKKSIKIIEKAMILAKKLGIRNIQLAGYDVYYEKGNNQTKKFFIESLSKVISLASKYSVMTSFEIMDTQFMGTITNYIDLMKNNNSIWLNLYPDLGNLYQWAHKNIEEELEKGIDKIVGIHFKDTKPGVFRDIPFGEGTVDFIRILKKLTELKYNGPFLIEMWSKNNEKETIEENSKLIESAKNFFEEVQKNVWRIKKRSS